MIWAVHFWFVLLTYGSQCSYVLQSGLDGVSVQCPSAILFFLPANGLFEVLHEWLILRLVSYICAMYFFGNISLSDMKDFTYRLFFLCGSHNSQSCTGSFVWLRNVSRNVTLKYSWWVGLIKVRDYTGSVSEACLDSSDITYEPGLRVPVNTR